MSAQHVDKNLASDSDSLQELIEASQILFDSLLFNQLLWDHDANMTMDHNYDYDDTSVILIHSHDFHCIPLRLSS